MTKMMANTTASKMQKPRTEKNEIQQSFKLSDVSSNELLNPNPKLRLSLRELSSAGVSFSEPSVVGATVDGVVVVVVATVDEVDTTVVVVVVGLAFVDRVVDVVVVVVLDRVVDVAVVVVVDRVVVDRVVVDRVVVVTTVVVVEVVIFGLTVVVVGLGVVGRTVVVVVEVVVRVVVDPVSPSITSSQVDKRHSSGDRQMFLPNVLITELSMHSVNRL
jgi:hypothetical protein